MRLLFPISLLLLVSACATQTSVQPVINEPENSPVTTSSEPDYPPNQPAVPAEMIRPQPAPVSIATDSLTALARTQYQARQYQSAIATAERGLRIDRRAAGLYLILAQSYMQLELPHQAANFVQQGLRYAIPESDTEIGLLRLRDILQQ